jgi:membrane-bound lytic murein transglycosylase D
MPKGLRWMVVVGLLVSVAGPAAGVQTPGVEPPHNWNSDIPYLPGLRTQVEFWKKVFAVYSRREVVIHDTERLDRVYSILDFRPLADADASDAEFEAYKREAVAQERERIRALLVRLHQTGADSPDLTPEERRIAAMFADDPAPSKFLDAAAEERIRSQTGLRERFAAGVEISRRYLPEMENIFRREGLPVELTRLPLVESCFNVNAYSKVGAAGIWQFMPATGRLYMRVDGAVDERRDPLTSTAAAAQHLKRDYEALGNWPLAITAYNHGRGGLERAVEMLGTDDLQEIVEHYHGPAFKFASRNFYAEFLAALEVEQNFEDYFGPLSPHRPQHAENVVVPAPVRFEMLAGLVGVSPGELATLNPALSSSVISGQLHVPRGYALRVPRGAGAGFETRFAAFAAEHKESRQRTKTVASRRKTRGAHQAAKARTVTHQVKSGQTLSGIARRYGTTVEAIRRRNKLSGQRVRSGQNLVIPSG